MNFLLPVAALLTALLAADTTPWELRDGDRVVLVGATLIERDQVEGFLETALTSRFPGRRVTFRNLGWAGDTVDVQMRPLNFGTLEEHVRQAGPTVIVVCYGLNEAFDGIDRIPHFITQYERLLDRLCNTGARLVLVAPNRHETLGPPLPDSSRHNASLAAYVDAIRDLARRRDEPLVNLFDGMNKPPSGAPGWTENGIHLTSAGYRHAAEVLERQLGLPERDWHVRLAASAAAPQTAGVQLSDLHRTPAGWAFTARDTWLPLPRTKGDNAPDDNRILQVADLAPGKYQLSVDGQPLATATAEQWAAGLALPPGPEAEQAEQLRQTIVDKNRWFFFRWRAHNAEYIVGRRAAAKSQGDGQGNSGNPQFPQEFAQLERLVEQGETEIARLAVPQSRRYTLERIADE